MTLSDKQISKMWSDAHYDTSDRMAHQVLAKAIEAEVRKQDEALVRKLVASLEGYRRNHGDTQPCDAERAGHARLDGTQLAAAQEGKFIATPGEAKE